MALDDKTLLKFQKSTEFAVKLIEDDSSEQTVVKVLHLVAPISAVGSIPAPGGGEMKATGAKIYVANEDWDKFKEQAEEKDGVVIYNGDMHLDVSKPNGRMVDGEFVITKPAKIWLTSTKFSRTGGQLRREQRNGLNTMINKMFSGEGYNMAEEGGAAQAAKTEPTVTGNKTKEEKVDEKAAKNGEKGVLKTT